MNELFEFFQCLQQATGNCLTIHATFLQSLGALIGIIALLFGLLYNIIKFLRRPGAGPSSEQTRKEFETLWPKLSALLETDVSRSQGFATETRVRAGNSSDIIVPVGHVHMPIRKDYELHMRTILNYRKPLAKEIQEYIQASEQLLRTTNRYNNLTYSESTDYELVDTKKKMRDASRRLEKISDTLLDEVRRLNDIMPKSIQ